jgi:hypothetical protein
VSCLEFFNAMPDGRERRCWVSLLARPPGAKHVDIAVRHGGVSREVISRHRLPKMKWPGFWPGHRIA